MSRFANAKDFVSYCCLAPVARLSDGKSRGMGNAKNGNAYLSRAMTEPANLTVRFDACAATAFEC